MSTLKVLKPFSNSRPTWFGTEDYGALIDLRSGRELGHYSHDGYGKWDLWLCLPYWQAYRAVRRYPAGFLALAGFPRCWIWLFRAKSRRAAMSNIEIAAGLIDSEWDR